MSFEFPDLTKLFRSADRYLKSRSLFISGGSLIWKVKKELTNEFKETTNDGLSIRRLLKFVGQFLFIHPQKPGLAAIKNRGNLTPTIR